MSYLQLSARGPSALVLAGFILSLPAGAKASNSEAAATREIASTQSTGTEPKRDDGAAGLLGPLRFGAFGGVGFPRPFTVEGMIKIGNIVGLGLEYGTLPQITTSGVTVAMNGIAVDARVFPMRSAFFIGVAAGRQQLSGSATFSLPAPVGAQFEQVSSESWYVNPRVGFLWTWSWGLTLGMDVGAQIPITSSVASTIPNSIGAGLPAIKVVNVLSSDVIPTVGLLHAGLLF